MLQALPAGVLVLDSQGLVRECNAAALELFGEPLLGQGFAALLGRAALKPGRPLEPTELRSGRFVNISSNSTAMVMPITTFYGASKAALANMSKAAAVHCASSGYNIRINTIHPGPHATEMILGGDVPAADLPGMRPLLKAIPMGRLGTPQELGKAVVFLASDDSSFMTAAELFTDGGLTGAEPVPRA